MPIDPVCGTLVDAGTSDWLTTWNSSTFHFCCESCLEEFERDPDGYAEYSLQEQDALVKALSASD